MLFVGLGERSGRWCRRLLAEEWGQGKGLYEACDCSMQISGIHAAQLALHPRHGHVPVRNALPLLSPGRPKSTALLPPRTSPMLTSRGASAPSSKMYTFCMGTCMLGHDAHGVWCMELPEAP